MTNRLGRKKRPGLPLARDARRGEFATAVPAQRRRWKGGADGASGWSVLGSVLMGVSQCALL